MTKQLDPRTLLKQLALPLLHEFFQQRRELLELPWQALREKKKVTPIYAAWQQLPEPRRREVQALLHEIAAVADEQGMAVRRHDLPKSAIRVTPAVTQALADALRDVYWPTQMRGHHCHIEHYTRLDGDEYFFAYLDDWPDRRLVFEDSGQMKLRSARFAFSVLFVYSPEAGSLELIANGGEPIQYPLQRAVGKSVLGIDIPPAHPTRPVYRLQQILDPVFAYPTAADDGIGRVQLKSIRWKPLGAIQQLKATVQEFEPSTSRSEWLDLIRRGLAGYGLNPTQAIVEGATFQLTLARSGGGRARTVEFTVVLPSRFRVSSKSDDMLSLGKRCLRQWGMIDV